MRPTDPEHAFYLRRKVEEMKRIAILTCLRAAGGSCTGSGCMRAFNERQASFAQYGDEELCLIALFHCNGCDRDSLDDPKLQEKLQRSVEIAPDAIQHVLDGCLAHGWVYRIFFRRHRLCRLDYSALCSLYFRC